MSDGAAFVSSDANRVDFWSEKRLPLEPKGRLKSARAELKIALRSMVPAPGKRLRASYREALASSRLFDVENILLYNVGPGNFRALSQSGIELVKENAPPPNFHGSKFRYYHRYEFAENSRPVAGIFADVEFSLKRLSSGDKPAAIWWAATTAQWRIIGDAPRNGFGLLVDAFPPYNWSGNPAALLKTLYDGILSSAHCQSAVPIELATRLAGQLSEPAERIISRLSSGIGPLGNKPNLVSCYRENTMWSPDDHLCMSSVLRFLPSQERFWKFKAAISEPWF